MPWVKSEYAPELAVLSAWVAALVPWSVTVHTNAPLGSVLFAIRFPLAEIQVRAASTVTVDGQAVRVTDVLDQVYPGVGVWGDAYLADPISAAATYERVALQVGSAAWALGAVLIALAVVLGVAMYRDEAATARRLPYDEVRVMGGLLAGASLAFAAASGLYYLGRDVVGVPVPIGVLLVGALAVALLRIDRV